MGGKPIQLQNECTATAAARCPVLRKTYVAYHPNNVVYRNWNDTCHMQRTAQSDLLCICKIAVPVTGELAVAYWANAALHTGDSCSDGSLAQTPDANCNEQGRVPYTEHTWVIIFLAGLPQQWLKIVLRPGT